MRNKYFPVYTYGREQDLYEDLIIESIKIYGYDFRYLPRTAVAKDHVWGEDALSTFDYAIPLEMYVKDVDGFQGDGHFLAKFDLEIRDTITLSVARKRWDQIQTEQLIDEVGYNLQLETANTQAHANTVGILMESGTAGANNYTITQSRPREGDLIYFPITNKIFEVKKVLHEEVFYQTGALNTYDLSCEVFEYSSERFTTGDTDIDALETSYSLDALFNQLLLEDNSNVLTETGGSVVTEFETETTDKAANNSLFSVESDNVIDFSEKSPFVSGSRY